VRNATGQINLALDEYGRYGIVEKSGLAGRIAEEENPRR
jgi:hypothetical protein